MKWGSSEIRIPASAFGGTGHRITGAPSYRAAIAGKASGGKRSGKRPDEIGDPCVPAEEIPHTAGPTLPSHASGRGGFRRDSPRRPSPQERGQVAPTSGG